MSSKADQFAAADIDGDFKPYSETPAEEGPRVAGMMEGRRINRNAATLKLDRLVADEQVRTDFDETELANLADSIRERGLLQPILVRWDSERDIYVILAGERRFRACLSLDGVDDIDCLITDRELSDAEMLEVQLAENLARQNLNPIEEAIAFQQLKKSRGNCTAKDMAPALGVAISTITRRLKLLTLPQDIQDKVAAKAIPASVIREVQTLKTEDEQRKLIAAYEAGDTYAEVTAKVSAKKDRKKVAAGTKTKKEFTSGGIKIVATAKGKKNLVDIAEVLEAFAAELRSDGRAKRAA